MFSSVARELCIATPFYIPAREVGSSGWDLRQGTGEGGASCVHHRETARRMQIRDVEQSSCGLHGGSSRIARASVWPMSYHAAGSSRGVVRGFASMDVTFCDPRWLQQENPVCDGMAAPP